MRKGIFFTTVFIMMLIRISPAQQTYSPYCYKYPNSEKLNLQLFEELYTQAAGYLNNGLTDSIEYTAVLMNSLSMHDYPLYDGLLEVQRGVISYFRNNKGDALKHFLNGLDSYAHENYYAGMNSLLNNIAIIFALVGDYQSSKVYLLRAIYFNEKQDLNFYSLFSFNLATVEIEQYNYEAALNILKKIMDIGFNNQNMVSQISVISSIITCYNRTGNRDEAEDWISRGYIAFDNSNTSDIDRLIFYTAVMEFHLNNEDYEKVLDISQRFNIDENLYYPGQNDHLEYLCKAYTMLGDYENGWKYENMLKEIHLQDNILDREEIITLLMVDYEENRNQRLKESIKKEMVLNKTSQEATHILMITLIVMLLFFIILFFILLHIRKLRNKTLAEFSRETDNYAAVNRELQKTNKELEKENKLLDTLISVFAHDLINPFQAIIGFSRLMVDDYESLDKKSIREYSDMLNQTAFQLNELLTNLQSIATIQEGKDNLKLSKINLKESVDKVVKLYYPLAQKKKLEIKTDMDNNMLALINPDILQSVLRNILNNAIKFSYEGAEIRIYSGREENIISLFIEDDGRGMSNQLRDNILTGNYLISEQGTGSEKGSGLGLTICIELLEMNESILEIDNSREKGITVILKIPEADA